MLVSPVRVRALADTDLRGGTASQGCGDLHTARQVEEEKVRLVLVVAPPTDLPLGVAGMEKLVRIPPGEPVHRDSRPGSEEDQSKRRQRTSVQDLPCPLGPLLEGS